MWEDGVWEPFTNFHLKIKAHIFSEAYALKGNLLSEISRFF